MARSATALAGLALCASACILRAAGPEPANAPTYPGMGGASPPLPYLGVEAGPAGSAPTATRAEGTPIGTPVGEVAAHPSTGGDPCATAACEVVPGRAGTPPPPPGAHYPFQDPVPEFTAAAPAMRIANLSDAACRAELARDKLPFVPAERAEPGVAIAMRVAGPVGGVKIVTGPAPSPFGVLDCHFGLALAAVADVLAPMGVAEVRIGSIYRKGARIAGNPKRTSQHARGLAMDVVSFKMSDGRVLVPERDWHATIGDRSCGPDAVMADPNADSIDIRNIYCALARSEIFHHMLSPSANRAHHDHLHFDIERGTKYRSID